MFEFCPVFEKKFALDESQLNLVIELLFVLHGFSTMTSSIKILLFDLHGFKIVLKLLKLPPEVVFRFGF